MIPLPAQRIGTDTISKIEAAAPRRFQEAALLEKQKRTVGAIYLYGYVVEIRLAAAYFRLIGYRPHTQITPEVRRRVIGLAQQIGLMGKEPHDIAGWARLVIATRKQRGTGYTRDLWSEIIRQATGLYARWRPGLRYRVTVLRQAEVRVVRCAAEWFEKDHRRL